MLVYRGRAAERPIETPARLGHGAMAVVVPVQRMVIALIDMSLSEAATRQLPPHGGSEADGGVLVQTILDCLDDSKAENTTVIDLHPALLVPRSETSPTAPDPSRKRSAQHTPSPTHEAQELQVTTMSTAPVQARTLVTPPTSARGQSEVVHVKAHQRRRRRVKVDTDAVARTATWSKRSWSTRRNECMSCSSVLSITMVALW